MGGVPHLDTDDVLVAEGLLDDRVLGEGDALLVDLAVPTLVDEVRDGLEVGLAVRDVGLNVAEHRHGGVVHLQKHGVVDLAEAEQLQDLLRLGRGTVDTTDADDEEDLGLGLDEEVAVVLGLPLHADGLLLVVAVLLDVLLGALEDLLAGGLALLWKFGGIRGGVRPRF